MNNFGERIRDLINKLGKDDQVVAKELGLSKSQMSHYVNGNRKVPSDLLQNIVDTYNINPQFLFDRNAPLYKDESVELDYYDTHVSAGTPELAEPVTKYNTRKISIPKHIADKIAKDKSIKCVKLNGESMNNVIPNGSLIGFKPISLANLKDGDIVLFNNDYEYSVKRFYNNKKEGEFIFKPDSTDKISFSDYRVKYEDAENLRIEGKVVMYLVELD